MHCLLCLSVTQFHLQKCIFVCCDNLCMSHKDTGTFTIAFIVLHKLHNNNNNNFSFSRAIAWLSARLQIVPGPAARLSVSVCVCVSVCARALCAAIAMMLCGTRWWCRVTDRRRRAPRSPTGWPTACRRQIGGRPTVRIHLSRWPPPSSSPVGGRPMVVTVFAAHTLDRRRTTAVARP